MDLHHDITFFSFLIFGKEGMLKLQGLKDERSNENDFWEDFWGIIIFWGGFWELFWEDTSDKEKLQRKM